MTSPATARSSWIQRYVLPGLAFKAVVIGGGYATGIELAQFFLPSGPAGGLIAILISTAIWSLVCSLTFAYAFSRRLLDYRGFFGSLLGRGWFLFEFVYLLLVLLILCVFGASSGAIGHALFDWPPLAGTLLLLIAIASVVAIGPRAVEPLFKYVSILLYATYALFLALSLSKFGARISGNLTSNGIGHDWLLGGITYAGYNSFAAVVVLPVLRHLTSRREAIIGWVDCRPTRHAARPVLFLVHDRLVSGHRHQRVTL